MTDKPYAFLGQYLVGNGFITQNQLDEAIRLQKENIALFGTIALNMGFVTSEQLSYLTKRQVQVDEQFGRLAMQEGFMTKGQLESVLVIQGRNHMCLGESLVRTGIMSNEALNEAISDFQAQIIAQETLVRAEIGNHPLAKGLLVTLDLTLRFFYRLGYAIHIVGRCDSAPDYVEYLFCSEQNFKKGNARYMAVGMSSIFFDSVAQSPGIHQRFDKPSPNATENMAQLMFNLNYMVCKKMKQLGMRVTHGAAFMDASAHGGATGVCVEMESLTGPMVLTYSDQPPGSVSFDM